MSVTQKKKANNSSKRKRETKTIIVTKSVLPEETSFPKKIKELNKLLSKAKLLS